MKTLKEQKKGITLIELVIALGIVGIISISAFTVMSTYTKIYTTNLSSNVDMQSLRSAMITVAKQGRNASTGTVSITGTKVLTISSTNFTVSAGKLQYGSKVLATNMSAISADYTDSSHSVIQVDLTSADGNTLSTRFRVN